MKAEANGNLVSDLAMPNRILSYLIFVVTKIVKLAHIRMDFRGIMQSAWTRKG